MLERQFQAQFKNVTLLSCDNHYICLFGCPYYALTCLDPVSASSHYIFDKIVIYLRRWEIYGLYDQCGSKEKKVLP